MTINLVFPVSLALAMVAVIGTLVEFALITKCALWTAILAYALLALEKLGVLTATHTLKQSP